MEKTYTTIDLFAEVFRNNIEDCVVHWKESKGYQISGENFELATNQFMISLRESLVSYLTSSWNVKELFENKISASHELNVNPLYSIVSSSIIQLIVNGTQSIISKPSDFIEALLTICESNYVKGSIFACVTFPMLYSGLQIKEMMILGDKFIRLVIEKTKSKFAIQLLCTLFNLFPSFMNTVWNYFRSNCFKRNDIIDLFAESLNIGASKLTPFHINIINDINQLDCEFLAKFLFKYYLPDSIRLRYVQSSNFIDPVALRKLFDILNFCGYNPQSIISKKFIDAILQSQPTSLSISFNNYPKHFIPSALSPIELSLLYDVLFLSGYIKATPKIISMRKKIPQSAKFGSFIIPIRKFVIDHKPKHSQNPLLFKEEDIKVINNQKYLRIYKQLKMIGKQIGQTPLSIITSPKTPKASQIISQHRLKEDQDFILYVTLRSRKKSAKSKLEFEEFMKNDWTRHLFLDLAREYNECYNLYRNILVHDIIIQNCLVSFKQTSIMRDESLGHMPFFYQMYMDVHSNAIVPKKEYIIQRENEMRSKNFAECLSFACQSAKNVPQIFVYKLLDEWSCDFSELQERFNCVAECERCEFFGTQFYYEIITNKWYLHLIDSLRGFAMLGVGTQIQHLLEMLKKVEQIEIKYGKKQSFAAVTLKVLIISGCDSIFTAFVWLIYLCKNIPDFFDDCDKGYITMFVEEFKTLIQNIDVKLLDKVNNCL